LNKALSIEPEAEYLLEDRYSHMEAREMLADIED
jgi:hypothetical protein